MSSKNPEAIEAIVSIKNQSDDDENDDNAGGDKDESLELQDLSSKPKVWTESEKPKRPSLLERMRSSRSKSKDVESSEDIDEDDDEDEDFEEENDDDVVNQEKDENEDEIRPLGEDKKRKYGKSSLPKRPSFQKQTSRYEDRLR